MIVSLASLVGCAGIGAPMERRYPTGISTDNIRYLNKLYQNPLQYALQQEYQWDEAARNIQNGNTSALVGLTALGGLVTYRVARNHVGAATAAAAAGGLVGLSLTDALIVTSRLTIYNKGIQAMECAIAAYGSAGGSLGPVEVDSKHGQPVGGAERSEPGGTIDESSYVPGLSDLLDLIDERDPLYQGFQGLATQIRSDRHAFKVRVNDPFILTVSRITGEVDEALLGTLVSFHDRVTASSFSTTPPSGGAQTSREAQAKGAAQKAADSNSTTAVAHALKSTQLKNTLVKQRDAAVTTLNNAQSDEATAQKLSSAASRRLADASTQLQTFQSKAFSPDAAQAEVERSMGQKALQNELDAKSVDTHLREEWAAAQAQTHAARERVSAAQAAVDEADKKVVDDTHQVLAALKAINAALESAEGNLLSSGNIDAYTQRLNACSIISFPQSQTTPQAIGAMSVSWIVNGTLPADPTALKKNTDYYGLVSGGKAPYTFAVSPDPADAAAGTVKVEFDKTNAAVVKITPSPGTADVRYTVAIFDSTKNADTALKLKVVVPGK